ncbi:hypothetical protein BV898_15738 [Hypsibius exemplaris]|uniref:Uncharacterized protein n=1 Tax=Hypsibius exemplaris TaxID=2072580 RepID=A0A9X6RL21_HYPEX|nr:hypothetical protein BV898_15738 [Hypsibius exemplaris]
MSDTFELKVSDAERDSLEEKGMDASFSWSEESDKLCKVLRLAEIDKEYTRKCLCGEISSGNLLDQIDPDEMAPKEIKCAVVQEAPN